MAYDTMEWEGKASGEQGGHVGCCEFYVLCVVLCLFAYSIIFLLAKQLVEIDWKKNKQHLLHCK